MRDPVHHRDTPDTEISVPIVEEQLEVDSREVPTARTFVKKKIEEREEIVDLPLLSENYRVERVPINLTVDSPPTVRQVGDTIIIPVVEEVAVVKKQLVLREELHIRRMRTELHRPQRVTLKREIVDVVTVPAHDDAGIDEFYRSGEEQMGKTIVGLFDNQQQAQMVVRKLVDAGFPQSDIHSIALNEGATSSDIVNKLTGAGVPSEEVRHYSSEIENGNSVLVLKTSGTEVEAAVGLLERNGAKGLDQRRGSATAGLSGNETTGLIQGDDRSKKAAIPVIEEELKVGKRQVQKGGVRIYTRTIEQPVEQDVSLRQEHLDVERRPVNRPASEQDLREFKEGTIEMTAMAEEAVVAKEAKVVEEVVVSKDVSEETRTIRDTVRKTQVNVDEKAGQLMGDSGQRRESIAGEVSPGSDFGRQNVRPVNDDYAYTYGQTLASDPRYRGKDWATIEPEARREWGTHNKGAWEEFKDKIRHAWERMTG